MGELFGGPQASNRLVEPLDTCLDRVSGAWRGVTEAWRASADGQRLLAFVAQRQAAGAVIYPATPFKALELTPLEAVRVVILGQDPYHGPGQAEGLAFSVPHGVKPPPSLRNLFAEQQRDVGVPMPAHGHLQGWAAQGVLLLNTCLTVEDGRPSSHSRQGWEPLTDALIAAVAKRTSPAVFMLWGAHAQAKSGLIESLAPGRHRLLLANHPSPLSARRPPVPFIGCGHFSVVQDLGILW